MANPKAEIKVCLLHELVVQGPDGLSQAFRYGQRYEMTPALLEALGPHALKFASVPSEGPTAQADQAEE